MTMSWLKAAAARRLTIFMQCVPGAFGRYVMGSAPSKRNEASQRWGGLGGCVNHGGRQKPGPAHVVLSKQNSRDRLRAGQSPAPVALGRTLASLPHATPFRHGARGLGRALLFGCRGHAGGAVARRAARRPLSGSAEFAERYCRNRRARR